VRIYSGQSIEEGVQTLPEDTGRQFHHGPLGQDQNIIGSILHLGLADNLPATTFDPVPDDRVSQPAANQNPIAGCGNVRETVNHGEILAFEPSTGAENCGDFPRVSNPDPLPGGLCTAR